MMHMEESMKLNDILELCPENQPVTLMVDGELIIGTAGGLSVYLTESVSNAGVISIETDEDSLKIWVKVIAA